MGLEIHRRNGCVRRGCCCRVEKVWPRKSWLYILSQKLVNFEVEAQLEAQSRLQLRVRREIRFQNHFHVRLHLRVQLKLQLQEELRIQVRSYKLPSLSTTSSD